uniref:Uncharacterized protein n=1 Tax=Arundo donax TaxID=35708 RepID=A0A0A9FVX1_ARUDO
MHYNRFVHLIFF